MPPAERRHLPDGVCGRAVGRGRRYPARCDGGGHTYIFVKDVYACASLAGALVCALLWRVTGHATAMIIGAMVVMVIRALSVTFHWNLPRAD